jgi:hypothetical protein
VFATKGKYVQNVLLPKPCKLRSGCPAAHANLGWKKPAVGPVVRCLGPVYMQPKNLCCSFFVVWRSRGRWFCSNTKFLNYKKVFRVCHFLACSAARCALAQGAHRNRRDGLPYGQVQSENAEPKGKSALEVLAQAQNHPPLGRWLIQTIPRTSI